MKNTSIKVCLLGASFNTGNLGVNALSESAIMCILKQWPKAQITLLGMDLEPGEIDLQINNRKVKIKKVPVRFSLNILLPYHFITFFLYALSMHLIRFQKFKKFCARRNRFVRELIEANFAMDITGGDSFSDIYGMKRFILGFIRKWLVMFYGNRFILLPQTYGPYKRNLSRVMARYIIKKSIAVFSRDQEGISQINGLTKKQSINKNIYHIPDLAFILPARNPQSNDLKLINKLKKNAKLTIGLNVSGLLYNGGYTQDNMFNLNVDYPELIIAILDQFLSDKKTAVVLIPHVFPPDKLSVESDPVACQRIYDIMSTSRDYEDRIITLSQAYDQNEIKYIISKCDLLIASRMHACIAALSQFIPAIGLAYSKKFKGVFESVGVEKLVLDISVLSQNEILNSLKSINKQRMKIKNELKNIMPGIKKQILDIFTVIPTTEK